MTEQEKQEIISAVLSSIRTNSKTISQLTSVSEMLDDDYIELNGGRKVSYGVLFANHVSNDDAEEAWENLDANKVDKDSRGLVEVHQAPVVFLDAMGSLDGHFLTGDSGLEYKTTTKLIYDYPGGKFGAPKQGSVYISKNNLKKYVWNGTDMEELNADECPLFVDYMQPVSFADLPVGGSYYVPSSHKIAVKIDESSTKSYDPLTDALYFFREKGMIYTWDADASVWVPASSDTKPVNDLETGGEDKALSAEMGKRLRAKVDEVQANIQRLYNNLGNIAFWDAAAKSSAAPVPIDWGNTKHTVTLALAMANAVVKHNGAVKSNGDTILVEEGGTLTLIVEPASGYRLTSVTSSTAGATVIDLGNGTYSVSIVMGGSNVTLDIDAETINYVTDGLVAFFDGLDKGSTANAWTDKVGGKVFTNDGATSIAKGWSFNGVGGLYNNDALNWPASGYTIEVCFKSNAASTTRTLFHQKTNDGIGLGLYPHSSGDGGATKNSLTIYCTGTSGNKKSYIDSAAASAFIGTISANVERMLINANAATGDNDNTLVQGVLNTIGGRWDSSGGSNAWRHVLSGEIYAIRIYSRKLSEAEMLQNINADNVVYELGLTLNT